MRAILGILVSSSRENMRILEDAVRQAYSPDSLEMMCTLTAAAFTRNDSRGSLSRRLQARLAKNGFFFGQHFFQYNKRLLRQKTGGACL